MATKLRVSPVLLLLLVVVAVDARPQPTTTSAVTATTSFSNFSDADECPGASVCKEGVIIPMWMPQEGITTGDRFGRGAVYLLAMFYCFVGVAIIADRFMDSIEVVTSMERKVVMNKPSGEKVEVKVRIWNETVSNLTLMAFGSSAPEILLAIIEIMGNNFVAGQLGPGTICGSAAFNLFMIIGLCVSVIPDDEKRRIKYVQVFFVTATWSLAAYIWMYLILAKISPGVIEIWEGLLTIIFFPVCVFTAWFAQRQFYNLKFLRKRIRIGKKQFVIEGDDEEYQHDFEMKYIGMVNGIDKGNEENAKEVMRFERERKEYMDIITELRQKHPDLDLKSLEYKAQCEMIDRGHKSRAGQRMETTKKLSGEITVTNKAKLERRASKDNLKRMISQDDSMKKLQKVLFEPSHYTVMENVGRLFVIVARRGGAFLSTTVKVDYYTEDATGVTGIDYVKAKGTVTFHPKETQKKIPITIIDDDIYELDKYFSIHLHNIRVMEQPDDEVQDDGHKAILITPSTATILILDDDNAGSFEFDQEIMSVHENCNEASIKVGHIDYIFGKKLKVPHGMII